MIENVLAPVADEEVFESVVVVVADTHSLSPPGMRQSSARGDVGEGTVAIVLVEVIHRLAPFRKTFQARPVDAENIQPAVVVVVEKGRPAAGGLEQVGVLRFAAEDRLVSQPRGLGEVYRGPVPPAQARPRRAPLGPGREGVGLLEGHGVVRLGLGEGVTGWVAAQRSALVVPDVRAEPRFTWVPNLDQERFKISRHFLERIHHQVMRADVG